jgi:cell division protein FtsW
MSVNEVGNGDRVLLGVVVILILLGILVVYSASSFRGAEKYDDSARFLKLHLRRVLLGFLFLFCASKFDYHGFRWVTPFMFFLFFGLLVVVLLGPEFHGSRRSILLFGKRFQPSEFMKLTLIFYLAAVFANRKRSRAYRGNRLWVHYITLLMIVGLVFIEPDLGTALVIYFIGFAMFYLSGIAWKQLAKRVLFLVPLILMGIVLFPYQRERFVDFWGSVLGKGPMSYQVKQSIIGLAHGGFMGVGYGAGKQKLFFLPEPFSDFILASFGEELGFVGILILFSLLVVVLWRGIRIALRAPDLYGYLLAGGITTMILVNALINAGVVVNLLPTTGLPFPFLSYGGSSLLVHLIGVGVLLNISKKVVVPYRDFTLKRGRRSKWGEDREII